MNRSDYNVGTLESEIKVQFEQAVQALDKTINALNDVTSSLQGVKSQLDSLKGNTGLKEVTDQAEKLKKTTGSGFLNKAFNVGDALKSTVKLGVIFATLRKGWNTVTGITKANIDMIETTNLFEVQMGKVVDQYGNLDEAQSQYYTKAMAFQNEMNEKLATNKAEMKKYQAMYFGMLDAQLGSENRDKSYFMSENLTKAGYDIASLYNLDVQTAMNKLKSGLAGQIESLRQIGIDVSEASLSSILDQVGIERSVQQLSYAEKEVARYIAICQQAGKAQGDFARTFEQPANQIRVFKNQMLELKQVAGSFFTGLLGQILPVVNGIIMAIKEVLKALGSVFGFEVESSPVQSSLGGVADTVGDIGSGLGSATKKAKEFKKQLMGFDEINNIEPPTTSGGGGSSGGGGTVGGIDSRLLDSLKEWDNMMDKISGKAQEIRDKMLEWLGFVRNDDGTWRLGEGLTNFEKILDVVKAIGIALGTWTVASTVTNLLKNLRILNKTQAFRIAFGLTLAVSGFYLLYKGIKHILDGNVDLFTILETIAGGAMGGLGIASLLKGIAPKLPIGNALKIGFGIELAIGGSFVAIKSFIDMLKEGFSWAKEFFMIIGTAIAAVGAIILGVPAGIAAAVAAIVATIATVIVVVKDNWEQIKLFFTDTIPQAWSNFWSWLGEKWNDFTTWLGSLPEKIGYGFGFILGTIVKFFTQTIPQAWSDFWNWIGQKWNDFTNWLSGLPSKIWEGLKNIGQKVVDFFTVTLPEAWNNFINWIKELPAKFLQFGLDIIQGLINGIKQAWTNFWTAITDFINGFVQGFKDALGIHSPSTVFQGFGINIIEGLINGIGNMVSSLKNKIFEIAGNITSWFNEKISNIKQIGSNIVNGITSGISSATSGLRSKVQGLASNVSSWFKNALGIHSPSKVMADLAQYIPAGVAKGIDDNANIVYDSMKELNQGIKINTKDFEVDTNQYVNYSAIKGQILAQSQVSVNNSIAEEIRKAVIEGFRVSETKVKIEAEANPDSIFKLVQKKDRENNMMTGEPSFIY